METLSNRELEVMSHQFIKSQIGGAGDSMTMMGLQGGQPLQVALIIVKSVSTYLKVTTGEKKEAEGPQLSKEDIMITRSVGTFSSK